MDKCQAACEAIKAINPAADVVPAVMDLGSLASVQKFVSFFKKQFAHRSLDVLMLNAGVMNTYPFQLTADGIEYQFGVNHVAHFYLTKSLFDMLSMNEARIVVVSSNTMWHTYDYGVSLRLAKGINNVEKYDPLLACKSLSLYIYIHEVSWIFYQSKESFFLRRRESCDDA